MQYQPTSSAPAPAHGQHPKPRHRFSFVRLFRIETFAVFLGVALLLIAVALYAGISIPGTEFKQVNSKEYQAVFINNTVGGGIQSSVYFGKITTLNDKYVVITNVFYIESNSTTGQAQQTAPANYTLRKLGTTELHLPEDKMIINKSQVTFWENLKDSSQVVTKINEYYKNPAATSTTPTTTTTKPAGQ